MLLSSRLAGSDVARSSVVLLMAAVSNPELSLTTVTSQSVVAANW